MIVGYPLFGVLLLLVTAAMKRLLLVGRSLSNKILTEQGGLLKLSNVLQSFAMRVFGQVVAGSEGLNVFLRLLGANIGSGAKIMSEDFDGGVDLITIGSRATIARQRRYPPGLEAIGMLLGSFATDACGLLHSAVLAMLSSLPAIVIFYGLVNVLVPDRYALSSTLVVGCGLGVFGPLPLLPFIDMLMPNMTYRSMDPSLLLCLGCMSLLA